MSHYQSQTVEVKGEPESSRYPSRERRRPDRYTDCRVSKYVSEEEDPSTNVDGSEKYKARYVAKGYSQKMGVDYDETFSHTANMTSVRVLMQKAAQENLILHQMDVMPI